jgi:metal-responsive CopG/Arc/MetJ family transcriptional regulator
VKKVFKKDQREFISFPEVMLDEIDYIAKLNNLQVNRQEFIWAAIREKIQRYPRRKVWLEER